MKQLKKVWAAFLLLLLIFAVTPKLQVLAVSTDDTEAIQEQVVPANAGTQAPKAKGTWKKKGKHYTFKKSDGTYAKQEWLKIKKEVYYFTAEGYRKTGWLTYLGKKYYFKPDGKMLTGWLKQKSKKAARYYLKKDGAMAANAWLKKGSKCYYFKSDGKMAKGWMTLNRKKYYFDSDGVRVSGTYFVKGKGYYFRKNGVYDSTKKVKGRGIDPKKPMIALTFDDGPGPYTNRLLNCLKKNNSVATFFVVGSSVNRYKSVVKRTNKLGCEIGNHSWDHPQLNRISSGAISAQLKNTDNAVLTLTGKRPTLLRPPYGAYNSTVAQTAGKPLILWDVDTLDWKTKNSQSTINSVMGSSMDGSIVLMHDIHLPTVVATETMIPRLIKKGYQLVTVSELAKYKKVKLQKGRVYTAIR